MRGGGKVVCHCNILDTDLSTSKLRSLSNHCWFACGINYQIFFAYSSYESLYEASMPKPLPVRVVTLKLT